MTRALLVGLAFLVGGCGNKSFDSLCKAQVPPPPGCNTACDPMPGAANACPSGYHCSAGGTCDLQCTQGGNQCGDGYTCTADGSYMANPGSGSNGPDASCPAINFTPMPVTPSILLVLDRSGSMAEDINGNNPPQTSLAKYTLMSNALIAPGTGVVTQLETKAYFGSELFTCVDAQSTQVSLINVPRALNNASAISASINGSGPGFGTPTPEAIAAAQQSFVTTPPPQGSPPVIVLATDGLPNSCGGSPDTRPQSVAAVKAAFAAGIQTYVLAIGTASQHFQDLANAGQGWQPGQPNIPYYPAMSAQQLKDAFQTIISGVVSCDLHLTSSIDPNDAMSGTVTVNGTVLHYGTDWVLVNGNIVRLLGAACTNLKSTPNPTVQAAFPCGSVIF